MGGTDEREGGISQVRHFRSIYFEYFLRLTDQLPVLVIGLCRVMVLFSCLATWRFRIQIIHVLTEHVHFHRSRRLFAVSCSSLLVFISSTDALCWRSLVAECSWSDCCKARGC